MSWRNEGLLEQVLSFFPLFPPRGSADDVFVMTAHIHLLVQMKTQHLVITILN